MKMRGKQCPEFNKNEGKKEAKIRDAQERKTSSTPSQ